MNKSSLKLWKIAARLILLTQNHTNARFVAYLCLLHRSLGVTHHVVTQACLRFIKLKSRHERIEKAKGNFCFKLSKFLLKKILELS